MNYVSVYDSNIMSLVCKATHYMTSCYSDDWQLDVTYCGNGCVHERCGMGDSFKTVRKYCSETFHLN